MRRSSRRKGLLLVELATHERWVYNSRFFPFIKGGAERLGFETLWLCFGTELVIEKSESGGISQYMRLSQEDAEILKSHVERFRPSHIIITHPMSETAMDALRSAGKGVEILSMSDQAEQSGVVRIFDFISCMLLHEESENAISGKKHFIPEAHIVKTDWLLRWLGEKVETSPYFGRYLVGTFTPVYDTVICNRAFRDFTPHIIIMGGLFCDHRRPIASNEYYAGLELDDCVHDFGCGFCTTYRGPRTDLSVDPLCIAEEQFKRIIETAGEGGRDFHIYDIQDIRLFRDIDQFFEMILRLGVKPATFCFEPRVDRTLEIADKIERLLPVLAAAGHKLSLFRMGAENLVEEENRRFNKHITLEQIDEVSKRLKELAKAYPSNFDYDPTLGYITCSPWTTLEMLEKGIWLAMEREFDPKGVWLYTPLLLFTNSPITKLAEREGDIIVNNFEDLSLIYEAVVNNASTDSFLPWRFRDKRTGTAFALMVRFCAAALRHKYPDTLFHGDALYEKLLEYDLIPGFFDRPDFYALQVIETIKEHAEISDTTNLLNIAIEKYLKVIEQSLHVATAHETDSMNTRESQRLRLLVESIIIKFNRDFVDMEVNEVNFSSRGDMILITLSICSQNYKLYIKSVSSGEKCFFSTENFAVSYYPETPIASETDRKKIFKLIRILDRALRQYAPELLPV